MLAFLPHQTSEYKRPFGVADHMINSLETCKQFALKEMMFEETEKAFTVEPR